MPPVAHGRTMARRADAPVIKTARRGSSSKAIAALHEQGLDCLVQELYNDRTAKSAVGDKETHLATWTGFHAQALGADVPVLPVTVWSLVCVASLFKKGDYRSFNQYVSSLKGFHVEAGHLWTQEIEYARAWCKRAVLRGIGPARQSHELDLPAVLLLADDEVPWSAKGPLWPRRVVSTGTAFLGR